MEHNNSEIDSPRMSASMELQEYANKREEAMKNDAASWPVQRSLLMTKVRDLEAQAASSQQELEYAEGQISDLKEQISDLKEQISDLEEKIFNFEEKLDEQKQTEETLDEHRPAEETLQSHMLNLQDGHGQTSHTLDLAEEENTSLKEQLSKSKLKPQPTERELGALTEQSETHVPMSKEMAKELETDKEPTQKKRQSPILESGGLYSEAQVRSLFHEFTLSLQEKHQKHLDDLARQFNEGLTKLGQQHHEENTGLKEQLDENKLKLQSTERELEASRTENARVLETLARELEAARAQNTRLLEGKTDFEKAILDSVTQQKKELELANSHLEASRDTQKQIQDTQLQILGEVRQNNTENTTSKKKREFKMGHREFTYTKSQTSKDVSQKKERIEDHDRG